jgi:putative chitobiose transport system substrate-binding protein
VNKFISIICAIVFVLITGIFFVCKPKHQNNEVVFWTLQMSDFSSYINGVIKDFETENPDIKIKWVDVPFSEGEKRTLASVLSDNPPDLVNLNPDFSSTLAHKKALWEIPQEQTNQYNTEILNSLKVNGKLYSIPWYATSAITIYNKDLLSSVPKTYDQRKSDHAVRNGGERPVDRVHGAGPLRKQSLAQREHRTVQER